MAPSPLPSATYRPAQWLAPHVGRSVSKLSRVARLGEGSVIGGKVALSIDRGLAGRLAAPMTVALVSGTNGKTTTTTLLALGLAACSPTATNKQGANLASGLTGALLGSPDATFAALEVDEAVLPWALGELHPRAVTLLNLSRDQLDRLHEVRATAERWRRALATDTPPLVVANADDPLVAWSVDGLDQGADGEDRVVWVGAGLAWQLDSSACPWCEADLIFTDTAWRCPGCGRARPDPSYSLSDGAVVDGEGNAHPLGLSLPGRSARANAAMAFAVIDQLGLPTARATASWAEVRSIEGRYQHVRHRGAELVLHLAKNPAGWADLLDLVVRSSGPLVLVLNAQGQDGRDPSWIWDVPFERLAGRRAYCLGERGLDLAVRLDYAGLDVTRVAELDTAIDQLVADQVGRRRAATGRPHRQLQRVPTGPPAPDRCRSPSPMIGIGLVRPDLLGTYGDGGNAAVLADRLVRRGIPAEVVPLSTGSDIPDSVAVLVLGGGEDAAQRALLADTRLLGGVARAAARGVPVLAVCAALQVLGVGFEIDGRREAGIGLLDVETDRLVHRAVGETLVRPEPGNGVELGATVLTGFENHGGRTLRGTGCRPLGHVEVGVGNGDGTDGAVSGHVVGTYLHGPVLARNPALADQLLSWAVGDLEPLSIEVVEQLHDERVAASARERRATDQIDAATEAGRLAGVRHRVAGVGARMGTAVSEATKGRRHRGASRD